MSDDAYRVRLEEGEGVYAKWEAAIFLPGQVVANIVKAGPHQCVYGATREDALAAAEQWIAAHKSPKAAPEWVTIL